MADKLLLDTGCAMLYARPVRLQVQCSACSTALPRTVADRETGEGGGGVMCGRRRNGKEEGKVGRGGEVGRGRGG